MRVNAVGIRSVSAKDLSFIFDGSIDYTWRDDSMGFLYNDGDPYTSATAEGAASQYSYDNPLTTGLLGTKVLNYGPIVVPDPQPRMAAAVNTVVRARRAAPRRAARARAANARPFRCRILPLTTARRRGSPSVPSTRRLT